MRVYLLMSEVYYEGQAVEAVCSSVERAKEVAWEIVQANAEASSDPPLEVPPLVWRESTEGLDSDVRIFMGKDQPYPGSYFHELHIVEREVLS